MSTIDFLKSVTTDDFVHDVLYCFDELMVLYNVIGNRQDIDICTDNSTMPVSFVLLMESEEDAVKLADNMNGLDFVVFGIRYIIDMTPSKTTVQTVIRKDS